MAASLGAGGRKLLSSLRRSNSSCVSTITETGSSENRASFPVCSNMDGFLKYEDLVGLLTCVQCNKFCGPTIVQCRKGHVICKACKADLKLTSCKVVTVDRVER